MSDRRSFSSTKYGPSVSAGRTTQAGSEDAATIAPAVAVAGPVAALELAPAVAAVALDGAEPPGVQAARMAAALPAPRRARTSRRVSTRPIRTSS